MKRFIFDRILLVSLLTISFFVTSCGGINTSISALKVHGTDTVPVEIEFATHFQIPRKDFERAPEVGKLSLLKLSKSQQKLIADRMRAHAMHAHGVFNHHTEPFDFFNNSGSIKDTFKNEIRDISFDEDLDVYIISYDFFAEGSFSRDVFGKVKEKKIQFYMPNDPVHLYEKIMEQTDLRDADGNEINPCTSKYDNSDKAFYYYWNFDWDRACPKRFLKSQIHLVDATFRTLPETRKSYPEYDRLYEGKTATHPLRIDIVHGYDEIPAKPDDVGRLSFQWDADRLDELGWETMPGSEKPEQRRWKFATDRYHAQVRLTIIDSDSKDFDDYVKDALRKSDIFIYSGHSRDGYYFDINRLYGSASALRRTKKYQIIYDNSCNSYTYFHESFFVAKRTKADPLGTANLDVMTNVISAPFFVEPSGYSQNYLMLMSLLGLSKDGKPLRTWHSWQDLLSNMFDHVEYADTAMTIVLGDEDNPTSSKKFGKLPEPLAF